MRTLITSLSLWIAVPLLGTACSTATDAARVGASSAADTDDRGVSARESWSATLCAPTDVCRFADVNGDGRADLVAFSHVNGPTAAQVQLSNGNGFAPAQPWSPWLCSTREQCATGDVNGD